VVWDAFQAASALTFEYGVTGWMPEGTPQEAIDAFAIGVEKANADPDFLAKGKQVTGGYPLQAGKKVAPIVKKALSPSPEVTAYLRDLLTKKYNVKL
jgi:hypothetical protein